MADTKLFHPLKAFSRKARIKSLQEYRRIYALSVKNPAKFWAEKAKQLHWFKKWKRVFRYTKKPFVKWFEGGKLNVSYNCLDRHLTTWRKNKAAIIWEGEPGDSETYTYEELHREVCKFANVLKKKKIKKGDRVCIYMPMIPALAISMLACARIGAIHSIIFCGFSAKSLRARIDDCKAKLVVTADGYFRRGEIMRSKDVADEALKGCKTVKHVIIFQRAKNKIRIKKGRDS